MTRHARNCTAGSVYSYHEKQKDAKSSGFGTNHMRVGKDSVRNFDCCCLSLQICQNPVISPDGFLYDKESILEYIVTKKSEYNRKLKEYEKQLKKQTTEEEEISANEELKRLQNFVKQESDITSTPSRSTQRSEPAKVEEKPSVSNMAPGLDKHVPSFWIPDKTPQAEKTLLQKPDKNVYCPMSGKPLKMKDMVDVKFTVINDPSDSRSTIVKDARYMCPVTRDTLGNSVPCCVIRTTGDVITMDCYENLVKKDMLHPLNGEKLTEKDIIIMQRGGTGFSSTNEHLQTKEARPVLQV